MCMFNKTCFDLQQVCVMALKHEGCQSCLSSEVVYSPFVHCLCPKLKSESQTGIWESDPAEQRPTGEAMSYLKNNFFSS